MASAPRPSSTSSWCPLLGALLAAAVAGCGGGAPLHHPPQIQGPIPGGLTPQGWAMSFPLPFSDEGGDVSAGRIVFRDARGAVVFEDAGTIEGAEGLTSGLISFELLAADFACGAYTGEAQLGDSHGSWSAPAALQFRILAGFEQGITIPFPAFGPAWTSIGDVDGDGRGDVAIAEVSGTRIAVRLQTAGGDLDAPIVADAGVVPRQIAVGDVDGDGRGEILVSGDRPGAPPGEGGRLVVARLDPSGTVLSASSSLPLGDDLAGPFAIADLDGDGDLDVAALRDGAGGPRLVLLLQSGGGLGTPIPQAAVSLQAGSSVVALDVDGDGEMELAVQTGPMEVGVLQRISPGAFGPAEVTGVDVFVSKLAGGDVDGDGLGDVLATGSGPAVLLGRTAGPLARGGPVAPVPGDPVLADVDGDGAADLVLFTGDSLLVSYTMDPTFFQRGYGFPGPGTIHDPVPAGAVAVGDVTGDGTPDVVASGAGVLYVMPHR